MMQEWQLSLEKQGKHKANGILNTVNSNFFGMKGVLKMAKTKEELKDDLETAEEEVNRIKEEMEDLKEQLDNLKGDYREAVQEVKEIKSELKSL